MIASNPIYIGMSVGDVTKTDLDNDGVYDLEIEVISIDFESKQALIEKKYISEKIKKVLVNKEAVVNSPSGFIEEMFEEEKRAIEEYRANIQKYYSENYENIEEINPINDKDYTDFPEKSEYPKYLEEEDFEKYPIPDWAKNLPNRPELPRVEYSENFDAPCGPTALYEAFRDLGDEVNINDINKQRKGDFVRGFLSIFSKSAKEITWPDEIEKIAKNQGYGVERIKGKNANQQTILDKSTKDSVVIIRRSLDIKHPLTTQHYSVFDTNYYGRADSYSSEYRDYFINYPEKYIHEIYVLKKK